MGIGLFEYAQRNPGGIEPEQPRQEIAETARSVQDQNKIQELKTSIARQIQEGREPQYILYTAIRAIAMLTNDSEWEQPLQETLDGLYSGIAQESFFRDSIATAEAQRETQLNDYVTKTRRQLTRNINACSRLQKNLETALQELETMAPAAEE